MSGDCLCCGEWHRELKRWKLWLFGEWERLWLCQACRTLDRQVLTQTVEWNIANLPIPDEEPDVTSWFSDQTAKPRLRVVSDGQP